MHPGFYALEETPSSSSSFLYQEQWDAKHCLVGPLASRRPRQLQTKPTTCCAKAKFRQSCEKDAWVLRFAGPTCLISSCVSNSGQPLVFGCVSTLPRSLLLSKIIYSHAELCIVSNQTNSINNSERGRGIPAFPAHAILARFLPRTPTPK